jgi:DNA polymerase-3 subunit delta
MPAKNYSAKGQEKGNEALAQLKERLKSRSLSGVYLFSGDEPFLIDYYVNEIKKLVLGDEPQSLNLVTFENKIDISQLIDVCDTFPVFAEQKLVLVRNSGLFYSKSRKEEPENPEDNAQKEGGEPKEAVPAGNKAQEELKNYLPDIPETTCLVFVESQVDKRLGLYKQLVRHGLAVEFNRQGPRELAAWIVKGLKTMGKTITDEAVQYLVLVSEPSMYTLKNELMKLDAYTGDRKEITLADVKLMATTTIKSVIFDLLDAVSARDAGRALVLLNDMLALKEPEQKILSMLSKQTGELLKIKMLLNQRATQAQINAYFQGKHPYALKMLQNQAQRMDETYLRALLKNCCQAEVSYKKGLIDVNTALEVLLATIKG